MSHHIHILYLRHLGGWAGVAGERGRFRGHGIDQYLPPMSTQLADSGITVDGYVAQQLSPAPDCGVGNALSRGSRFEAMLDRANPYVGAGMAGASYFAGPVGARGIGTHAKPARPACWRGF